MEKALKEVIKIKEQFKQAIRGGFLLFILEFTSFFSANVVSAMTEEEKALEGCFTGCGVLFWVVIGLIALNVALLVWVAKDAKNRGMDNSVVWMILVLVTGLLGLIIYVLSRPKGELVECENCANKKLEYAKTCPHCGHEFKVKKKEK